MDKIVHGNKQGNHKRGNQSNREKEKIILPKNTQQEMIKFFLRTSMPRLAMMDNGGQVPDYGKQKQQTSPDSNQNPNACAVADVDANIGIANA